MYATVGDRLVQCSSEAGEGDRVGTVIGVPGADGGPPYRVRWDEDGSEDLVSPGPESFFMYRARFGQGDPGHGALIAESPALDALESWAGDPFRGAGRVRS